MKYLAVIFLAIMACSDPMDDIKPETQTKPAHECDYPRNEPVDPKAE